MDTFDESGDKVAYTQMAGFIVGAGGFGGKRDSPKMIPTVDRPKRNPDFSIKEKVHHNQVSSSLKSYQKRMKRESASTKLWRYHTSAADDCNYQKVCKSSFRSYTTVYQTALQMV